MSDTELTALTELERVALIALHKLVIRADNQLSVHETAAFRALALEMGEARFRETIATANERYPSDDAARRLVDEIRRPAARRLLYGRLLALAGTNRIAEPEAEMLRWMASRWALAIDPGTLELTDP